MSFSFKGQLRQGELGEMLYFKANEGRLKREDGRVSDFSCLTTGGSIELKSDFYSLEKTPNFFFERLSNEEKGTPGGPWSALAQGVETFVYFYVPSLTYFTFKTKELVEALEGIVASIPPTKVVNTNHVTVGFRVPRELLAGLSEETTLTVSVS